MMGSLTTSYFAKAKKIKGIKISIARYNSPTLVTSLDLVETSFAPSPGLLKNYKTGKINWEGYIKIYTQEQRDHFKQSPEDFYKILEKAAFGDVVLFCYEKFEGEETKCHRLLLYDMFKKIAKKETMLINFIDENL